MHECPECGQACDCDGDDTWIGWPANIDCSHECENDDYDYDPFEGDYDDEGIGYIVSLTLWQRIARLLYRFRPYRCDVCKKWTFPSKHDPCCSQECMEQWVPF